MSNSKHGQTGHPDAASAAQHAFSKLTYRPEIDGLRAVAVLSVLLFHLGIQAIPAGFVGVDIFFVISGYLICAILLHELQTGSFSFSGFYRRRALRILPPFLVVLGVTVAVALAVMLPGELRATARSAVAALLFGSNVHFWMSFDYFTPDAKEDPLLHTWSLGVEEQFYILVPIVLWLCFRYARRWLVPVFGATVVLSFGLSVIAVHQSPTAAFYLLPTRYWEMGVGALLAMLAPRIRLHGIAAEVVALLGMVLITVGLFGLTVASVFPGPAALWSVLGAAAVIATGAGKTRVRKTFVTRGLAQPVLVFFGRISYSLYLWHWPLIVLWKIRTGPELSVPEVLGLGLTAIGLATLSTWFVEAPFRKLPARVSDTKVLGLAGLILLAVLGATLLVSAFGDRMRSYPAGVAALDGYANLHEEPAFIAANRRDICFLTSTTPGGFSAFVVETCLGSDHTKPQILMLGDSLSAHLWAAASAQFPKNSVLQANASGCRPFVSATGDERCVKLMEFVYQDWIPKIHPDTVVLSARWRANEEVDLVKSIAALKAQGVGRVIVLGPTVEYQGSLVKLLARDIINGGETASHMTDPTRWDVDAVLAKAVTRAGADYVSLLDILCPDHQCRTKIGDTPISFDYGHYTPEGARFVAQQLPLD